MQTSFEYASEIDDGTGYVTHFKITGNVSCYNPNGAAKFDIEDITNLQTNQSLCISELPIDEQANIRKVIELIIEQNKDLAHQEYIEGLHEWQREHEG